MREFLQLSKMPVKRGMPQPVMNDFLIYSFSDIYKGIVMGVTIGKMENTFCVLF